MSEIIRPFELRQRNRAKILRALRQSPALSQTEIGRRTDLSAATVSAITNDLLDQRVLLRQAPAKPSGNATASTRGRPRTALSFNPAFASIGTIGLHMNRITVSIENYRGNLINEAQVEISTRDLSQPDLLQIIEDTFRTCLTDSVCISAMLKQITLGVQGTTDVKGTTLLWSPITTHTRLPLQEHLQQAFGVPVSVQNDCNMMSRALRWQEPETFNTDFATILLSQGIGMGLYHNDELVKGKHSSATEFGHMAHKSGGALCRCNRRGCIEAYAGIYAIHRNAASKSPQSPPQDQLDSAAFDQVIARANAGDPVAIKAFETAGTALGAGLASLFALIDSFPVAFIGPGSKARKFLEKPIREAIGQLPEFDCLDGLTLRFFPDEIPLIRYGCAITALMDVDQNLLASGTNSQVLQVAE